MAIFTDQLGRLVTITGIPKRIISLVPSQTELLYDLGLNNEVVGITKFCIRPDSWFKSKVKVGGTKSLHTATIKMMAPDLILANKEENTKEQIDELAKDYPVWVSDINTLDDACNMIREIGKITEHTNKATAIVNKINENFLQFIPFKKTERTCYLIWRDPYMTIGGDTFINHLLNRAGFKNIFDDQQRYPEITIRQLADQNCQLLLLSSEPFPFKEKHVQELQQQLPFTKIALVDGEMFSWYGSRLIHAPAYFSSLIQSLA
jgi:ABC-type Fe3+-hydroxamate transport system substrate-binding protein